MLDLKAHLKPILSKTVHYNHSLNEDQSNKLKYIQSHLIYIFTNCIIRSKMRFQDFLDTANIEYNHPYSRRKIRANNRDNNRNGSYYIYHFGIVKFCLDLLDTFFPLGNFIWTDFEDETYVNVLQLVRVCTEYGFFQPKDADKLVDGLANCAKSLRKLEDAWKEKFNSIISNPGSTTKKKLTIGHKLKIVANNLARSKEHMACVVSQLIC